MRTDDAHGNARIEGVDGDDADPPDAGRARCAVVAGFQGIGPDDRVTTLGRGGSDTSAVALAAALKAERCDIYTDVDGVYTTDPRIVPRARKLAKISYEEMLELASVGAKVLQTRSVELAMKERVRVQVLCSFEDKPGTLVVDEDEIVEQADRVRHRLFARRGEDHSAAGAGPAGRRGGHLRRRSREHNVNVDMIVQNVSAEGTDRHDLHGRAAPICRAPRRSWTAARPRSAPPTVLADPDVAKISVVGVGMRSHAGVANTMFEHAGGQGRSTSR